LAKRLSFFSESASVMPVMGVRFNERLIWISFVFFEQAKLADNFPDRNHHL